MRFLFLLLFCLTSKLYSQYEWNGISQDHQRHFATSAAINGMLYITAYDYFYAQNPLTAERKAQVAAATITISAGILKELYDYTVHKRLGTWNNATKEDMYKDMLSNILGVVTVNIAIPILR